MRSTLNRAWVTGHFISLYQRRSNGCHGPLGTVASFAITEIFPRTTGTLKLMTRTLVSKTYFDFPTMLVILEYEYSMLLKALDKETAPNLADNRRIHKTKWKQRLHCDSVFVVQCNCDLKLVTAPSLPYGIRSHFLIFVMS